MHLRTLCFLTLIVAAAARAQNGASAHHYMGRATIAHRAGFATITADDPRPLLQAIVELHQEYGWIIDYEDPPYEPGPDLVVDTDPSWRAAHPYGKDVTVPAGGRFESSYPESQDMSGGAGEERALAKIVSDYNGSGNPGQFRLIKQADGSFAVVGAFVRGKEGRRKPVGSILETRISLPVETRGASQTIDEIFKRVTAATGVSFRHGGLVSNYLDQSMVTVGGVDMPARSMLLRMIDGLDPRLQWFLTYDADIPGYAVSVVFSWGQGWF